MVHQKIAPQGHRTILAGDIGATKTLLAIFSVGKTQLLKIREERLITKDCGSLEEAMSKFLDGELPEVMSFGVAGPVMDGKVNITNVGTTLDSKQLSEALNGTPVYFINDLRLRVMAYRI